MIFFIELKMNEEVKVLVNVNRILNFFENKDGRTVIVQSGEESFSVSHTLEDVKNMLGNYYPEIKIK